MNSHLGRRAAGGSRGVEHYDKRALDRIVAGVAQDDFRLSRLVIENAQSEPFRMRRGASQ